MFKLIWKSAIIPQSWKESIIKPIPKKIENYRPISLIRKLYEKLLLPKFTTHPFRHCGKRDCIDAVATLGSSNKERFMAFLDIKAAYNSVDSGKN